MSRAPRLGCRRPARDDSARLQRPVRFAPTRRGPGVRLTPALDSGVGGRTMQRIKVSVDARTMHRLERYASEAGVSRSAAARMLMRDGLMLSERGDEQ